MPKSTYQDEPRLRPSAPLPMDVPAHSDLYEAPPPASRSDEYTLAFAPLNQGLGSRADIERELDGIALSVRGFFRKQPDVVMREIAAYSARLSELYVLLHRAEGSGYSAQYVRIRTQQVEIWRDELETQFKIASRTVEIYRQDLAMTGGMT